MSFIAINVKSSTLPARLQ